jgi:hypothetical protein
MANKDVLLSKGQGLQVFSKNSQTRDSAVTKILFSDYDWELVMLDKIPVVTVAADFREPTAQELIDINPAATQGVVIIDIHPSKDGRAFPMQAAAQAPFVMATHKTQKGLSISYPLFGRDDNGDPVKVIRK